MKPPAAAPASSAIRPSTATSNAAERGVELGARRGAATSGRTLDRRAAAATRAPTLVTGLAVDEDPPAATQRRGVVAIGVLDRERLRERHHRRALLGEGSARL